MTKQQSCLIIPPCPIFPGGKRRRIHLQKTEAHGGIQVATLLYEQEDPSILRRVACWVNNVARSKVDRKQSLVKTRFVGGDLIRAFSNQVLTPPSPPLCGA